MSLSTQNSVKSEIKNFISLSLPLVSSQIIFASSGFMGTLMVAHLSQAALAASVLVNMIWFSLSVFFFGILNAVSILVSHQHGAENKQAIREIMGQAYLLGILVFTVLLLTLIYTSYFLKLSNTSPEVLSLAREYLYSMIWTAPGLILLIVCEQFLAGIGEAKLVLRISLMIVPMEIFFMYIWVFGKAGLPAFGIAGIGYGLAVSFAISAIFLIIYLLKAKRYRDYRILTGITKINFHYQKELIRVGLPMGIMHVIEVTAFAAITFWMASFGTTVLAAHQIVMQFLGFIITIVFAVSQAVTIRVGHEVGKQNLVGVKNAITVGLALNTGVITLIILTLLVFPTFFLRMDIDVSLPENYQLTQTTISLIHASAMLILFDNVRIIMFGALRGLKDTQFPMYASFINFWVIGVSTAYLFAFMLGAKEKGLWWGLTLGIASGSLILFLRLNKTLKQADLKLIFNYKSNNKE